MYQYYNPNPCGKNANDCVIRAMCCMFGRRWDDVYIDICAEGVRMCDMPSTNSVWSSFLRKHGCKRFSIPDGYTIKEYVLDHPEGVFILSTGTHVVCAKDGTYYDSFDSGSEIPEYVFRKER